MASSVPPSNVPPVACPSEDAFAAFVAGTLDATAAKALEAHVDGCASCRGVLAWLARDAAKDEEKAARALAGTLPEGHGARPGATRAALATTGHAEQTPTPPPPRLSATPEGAARALAPGEVIAGRFEVAERIAAGGMGVIFRARDRHTAETIAVKVLQECSDEALDRFEREALILAELRHPSIVRYVAHGPLAPKADAASTPRDSWSRASGFFLAMEWLEGEDLAHRLKSGPLDVDQAIALAERVARSLFVAHERGIVHRDLKPSNIFLRGGKLDDAVLLDFGVARLIAPDFSMTNQGMLIGTPSYMSPEQALAGDSVDARADVFALGAILFECVTGARAFRAEALHSLMAKIALQEVPRLKDLVPDVPAALDELVARMLAKEPEDRPADAGEVARALSRSTRLTLSPPTERDARPSVLGKSELRVHSVVMATPGADAGNVALGSRGRATLASYGGRVETLPNGTLLVTFAGTGAPTDQAARAAHTALELRRLLASGAPVAIATGRADPGAVYPLGEAIDRAGELVQLPAPPPLDGSRHPIRLDTITRDLLGDRFALRADTRGPLLLRTKDGEGVRTLLGRATPCVGRDADLALLEALAAQSASEPVARVAIVTGPAGIGKSRLRYELLRRLRAKGDDAAPEVWSACGDPMRAGSTFGLVADALRETTGLLAGEPLDVGQSKLCARVSRHVLAEDAPRVTEFLCELLGLPVDDGGARSQLRAARLEHRLMGDQIRRAWLDFAEAECRQHPVVVLLEDLHWGDLATVELLDAALGRLAELPFAIIALGRPDTYDTFPNLWAKHAPSTVRLGALSRNASERLARAVIGKDAPEATIKNVVDLSGGNAFFLEELLRAVAEGRGDELPANVVAMAQARLEALDADQRRLLRAASVFGTTFWWGGVRALVGEDSAVGRLEDLVRAELLTAHDASKLYGERELGFRHALVREAAYAMLPEEDRALGHKLAAAWLEAAGETDAMTLAEHHERAGNGPEAARWYRTAAVEALEGNDYGAALRRAERGLACNPASDVLALLHLARAQACRARGQNAAAYESARQAIRGLDSSRVEWGAAAREAVISGGNMGDAAAVAEIAALVDPRLPTTPVGSHVLSAAASAAAELTVTQPDVAPSLFAAVLHRLSATDGATRANLELSLVAPAFTSGNLDEYNARVTAAMMAYEEIGDMRGQAHSLVNLGVGHAMLGEWGDALSKCRQGLAIAQRLGLGFVAALARHNLGPPLLHFGKVDEALKELYAAEHAFRTQQHLRLLRGTHELIARALWEKGDLRAAEAAAQKAVDLGTTPATTLRPLAVLARVRLARGDRAGALVASADAFSRLAEDPGGAYEAVVRLAYAEALLAHGEPDRARDVAVEGRERLLARAGKIRDAGQRESFLSSVPEHARLLALAGGKVS